MRIIFLGDIVGAAGQAEVVARLPELRETYKPSAVIVNAENAAQGYGLNGEICKELYAAGADCITTGNHTWDKREIIPYIEKERRLLRPLNSPELTPGQGAYVIETADGKKILVVNLIARVFMKPLEDPFPSIDALLKKYKLGVNVDAIFIDFHGEASSEKGAMGYFCDGRASFVVGTHTHIPTADARILPKGTGFQTDAGMCGCYDSVLGMDVKMSMNRFLTDKPRTQLTPVEGPVTLCGVLVDIDPATGLCMTVTPLRMGGHLQQKLPIAA